MTTILAHAGQALTYLLWVALWLVGGWWLTRRAFSLSDNENWLIGIASRSDSAGLACQPVEPGNLGPPLLLAFRWDRFPGRVVQLVPISRELERNVQGQSIRWVDLRFSFQHLWILYDRSGIGDRG